MNPEFIPYIKVQTVDDLLRLSYQALLDHGTVIKPSKGDAIEISGISFELTNPRARLSQSLARGKMISALGELCWYLSGSESGRFMDYYLPGYSKANSDDPDSALCKINGAYGPRIFGSSPNQFEVVREILERKPFSRQAVIQVFSSDDIFTVHKDVPCTCTLQFLIRENKLDLIVYMRSNDAYLGLPHDVFSFTMLQEVMANGLNKSLGTYKHVVGSFHLYEKHRDHAHELLSEGWYSTDAYMPVMPKEGFEQGLELLLASEREIRESGKIDQKLDDVDVYWSDLIKMLQAYRADKDNNHMRLKSILDSINCSFYTPYLMSRLNEGIG